MNRILKHLRANTVGYIALFVALGGTGYAAITLPPGSVGERQIRNHAIDAVKFNPKFITGSVRAWAIVTSGGRVIRGGGKPRVGAPPIPGSYEIRWGVRFKRNCSTVATIDGNHSPPTERIPVSGNPSVPVTAGYAVADSSIGSSGHGVTFVSTFNQQGQLTALGFDAMVVC